jgi:SPP1 gp7 family putative phage head morphogenesis protein
LRSLSLDEKTIKGNFKPSRAAEQSFFRALKKVAHVAGHIIEHHTEGVTITRQNDLKKALEDYSKLLDPWARRQSAKLLEAVQRSNKRAYQNKSKAMGLELHKQLVDPRHITAEGIIAAQLQREQVDLIKSIPLEAGLRAQKIAEEAFLHGMRAEPDEDTILELKKQLGSSTEVAVSRAKLIAVTETARANSHFNQARAMTAGSRFYRWHNSGDEAVRPSHKFYKGKRLQGMIFSWDEPPTLDDGMTGHPGTFPRCRCFAEPVFDE